MSIFWLWLRMSILWLWLRMWGLWRFWWIWFWCRVYWILGIKLPNKDISEATLQRCSYKKVFWKDASNSQENTYAEVRFQVQNHTSAWVFSSKFAAYFQNTFLNTCRGLLLIFGKFRWRIFYYFSSTAVVIHRCSLKRNIPKNFAKVKGKYLSLQIVGLPSKAFICILSIFGSKVVVSERDSTLVWNHALQCSIRFRQVASGIGWAQNGWTLKLLPYSWRLKEY